MFKLETPRLVLIQTPLHVVETRLKRETFIAPVEIGPETWAVTFPAEWPGGALGFFPARAEQFRAAPETVPWDFTLVDRATRTAVGQMGFKGLPDETGTVELGYGVNPSAQGRGLATGAAQALTGWVLARPQVRRVTAECLDTNLGSVRVLDKAGFSRVGTRHDEEGGLLILWERTG